jgi:hypothetical protein
MKARLFVGCFLSALSCFNHAIVLGQTTPGFLWAVQSQGATAGFAKGIYTDSNGYSFVTGFFGGTSAFGTNNLASYGQNDIFVARLNPNGTLLWVRHAGTANSEEGLGIAADTLGNCFVTGWYNSAAGKFDTVTLPSFGGQDVFVAKYDVSGNLKWAVGSGGSATDNGLGIATDTNGNCYVTGVYSATANFSGTTLTNAGSQDMFVAKYDTAGSLLWVRRAGGAGADGGGGIGVDALGNCYVVGGYSSTTIEFDTITITNAGQSDFFIAKYNTSGVIQWVQRGGGLLNDSPGAGPRVAVDPAGNAYVHGTFQGTATFGTNVLVSSGSNDLFVAKYDTTGNLNWIKQAGGTGNEDDFNCAIAVDQRGNCYAAGSYLTNATFAGLSLTNAGDHDVFVAKYDPSGALQYAQRAGGTNYDYCRGVGVDRNGNCYLGGTFTGTASFQPFQLTSVGSANLFVAKLAAYNPGQELNLNLKYTNGTAQLSVVALAGQSMAVDVATNLAPPATWVEVTNAIITNNPYVFSDPGSANRPTRFYRARLAP